jgi:hypothetical protein
LNGHQCYDNILSNILSNSGYDVKPAAVITATIVTITTPNSTSPRSTEWTGAELIDTCRCTLVRYDTEMYDNEEEKVERASARGTENEESLELFVQTTQRCEHALYSVCFFIMYSVWEMLMP